jgi:ankyrin repeat protein
VGSAADEALTRFPGLDLDACLGEAAFCGDADLVRRLLAEGLPPDGTSGKGVALFEAIREPEGFFTSDSEEVTRLLLDAGANVNQRDRRDGRSPLHYAQDPRAARMLLERGADPNAQANDGSTPLHECAEYGNVETARLLLAAGADACLSDSSGRTPRDVARAQDEDGFLDDESVALLQLFGN